MAALLPLACHGLTTGNFMSPALHETVTRAANRSRPGPARWSVCIKGRRREVLARLVLASHDDVAELALKLERMGFVLGTEDPDPCDFVFLQVIDSA
jgi:hypothetical protein